MIFVIHRSQEILRSMNATLPVPTLILVKISVGVRRGTPFYSRPDYRIPHRGEVRAEFPGVEPPSGPASSEIPVFGFLSDISLSRFARTFAILLKSGIPIIKS